MSRRIVKEDLPKGFWVASVSTVVEWYDFTLYLYFASVLSRVFFVDSADQNAMLVVLAGFAVSYLMRPLGALVFGHFGDRYGRRLMLTVSMALMGTAMGMTALLPDVHAFAHAGIYLLALRAVMAFAVGAEYTGAVTYLLEIAPARHRGLMTSCAAAFSEVGALGAALVSAGVVYVLSEEALLSWGWRLPFALGALMALVVWCMRWQMHESPAFIAAKSKDALSRAPIKAVLRYNTRGLYTSFAISALGSISYYVGIVYVPLYLISIGIRDEGDALGLSVVSALAVILVTPFFGALGDRCGRRWVLIALAMALVVAPPATFYLMTQSSYLGAVIGAVFLASLAGGVSAVGAAATSEQFDASTRLSGLALGTTAATAVFGGGAPFVAHILMQKTDILLMPALMIAVVALAALPVLWTMPRR